jgi:hypothetical protein
MVLGICKKLPPTSPAVVARGSRKKFWHSKHGTRHHEHGSGSAMLRPVTDLLGGGLRLSD